jgi:uncharacterized protein (TIGR02117 family)
MRKAAKRLGLVLAIFAGALVVAVVTTARPGDPELYPPAAGASVQILITHNGYHSGVLLPRPAVAELASRRRYGALIAVTTRFSDYNWLEIGWGEEKFYRYVPTPGSLTPGLALRALFRRGNASVLHVVGAFDPRIAFPRARLAALDLSEAGFDRLIAKVDATFARRDDGFPKELGPGLYGPSLFYRAIGDFHILHVCNHWVADILDAAGVPTSPVLAIVPRGLFLDLSARSGVTPLPQTQ